MNYKMILQYDGSAFRGWQRQGNTTNTIQGCIEDSLDQCLQESVEVIGSGRTDRGVHAINQVANFHSTQHLDTKMLKTKLAKCLPDSIRVESIEPVSDQFHSRKSAKSKEYLYCINTAEKPSVFKRKYVYHCPALLNIEKMIMASKALIGTHDFTSFTSDKRENKSKVRTIYDIKIKQEGDMITILYRGNGFLYHMVRILTGTLIDIGLGNIAVEDMKSILTKKDRQAASLTAPAHGLFLKHVSYKD